MRAAPSAGALLAEVRMVVRLARSAPWVLSVLVVLAVLAVLVAPGAAAPAARRSARRCVGYSQKMEPKQTGVLLRLRNGCGFPVSCRLEWKLVCAGGPAGDESASLELARREAGSVRASADACERDWQVADVRWTCDPVR
jgi:hypothetical protein